MDSMPWVRCASGNVFDDIDQNPVEKSTGLLQSHHVWPELCSLRFWSPAHDSHPFFLMGVFGGVGQGIQYGNGLASSLNLA